MGFHDNLSVWLKAPPESHKGCFPIALICIIGGGSLAVVPLSRTLPWASGPGGGTGSRCSLPPSWTTRQPEHCPSGSQFHLSACLFQRYPTYHYHSGSGRADLLWSRVLIRAVATLWLCLLRRSLTRLSLFPSSLLADSGCLSSSSATLSCRRAQRRKRGRDLPRSYLTLFERFQKTLPKGKKSNQ